MDLPPKSPPDIPALIDMLAFHEIRYVITGSVAAQLYGVELQPGDFDVTPAVDKENLERLAALLMEIDAVPASLGHWQVGVDGEKTWVGEEVTPETLASWQPDANDPSSLDHLFLTSHGNFDVVPELVGDYETLKQEAVQQEAFGHPVWLAHVDELLTRLTVPRRKKDGPRVRQLREIQRRRRLSAL